MRSAEPNVADWLRRHAEAGPERPALVDAERRLDYGALEERCARLAAVLAEAGVGAGDRVAILLANRSAYVETVFAATRLGAIAVPMNARLAPPEIARQWDDCTPKALVHEDDLGETVARAVATAEEPPGLRLATGGSGDAYEDALAGATPRFDVRPASPDDPNMIMYTSGTTGVPKGALLPHRKMNANSENAVRFFGLRASDRVGVPVPLFHSFGLNILATPALYAGATLVLQQRFEAAGLWQLVDQEALTFFGGVPTMFRALLDELERDGGPRPDLSRLRFAFTAGAAIPVELIRAFEARGLVLKQGFGQTETSILCCLDAADALRKAGSVGKPVHIGEVRIVHIEGDEPPERWRDVAPGETGEIVVRGPITMLGYWNQPEATAATLRGDWLRTNDLATRDDEGFVTLVGRARDMYISGGENVYPAEVEAVLGSHPRIREVAVVGEPDERWGEVGRAYVVTVDGEPLDENEFRAWARGQLAAFKLPKRLSYLDALPRTVTGKVQKHRLGA